MIQVTLLMLLTSLAVGLPVAAVLALTGYVLSENYAFIPMTAASGELAWSHSNDFVLIAAPMFIMMGELMHRSGVSERLFSALTPWFTRVPGQLIHTNIAASAVFAATPGSSLATAATIGAAPDQRLTVSSGRGSISLPWAITDMPDQVVWLPLNSPGSAVHRSLGVSTGSVVRIEAGGVG